MLSTPPRAGRLAWVVMNGVWRKWTARGFPVLRCGRKLPQAGPLNRSCLVCICQSTPSLKSIHGNFVPCMWPGWLVRWHDNIIK